MVVHFHWHSRYSLLEWIGDIGSIAKQASALWMKSIALTDYNGMYGAIEFMNKCKKSGVNPIVWVDLPLVYDVTQKKVADTLWYVTLIAMHYDWYYNLLKIASIAQTTAFFKWPRIDLSTIKQYGWGVLMLRWWHKSVITTMLWNGENPSKILDLIQISQWSVDKVIGEISVQSPHMEKRTWEHNKLLFQAQKELWIDLVAGCNFHYIKSWDKLTYEVGLCAKDQIQFSNPSRRKVLWDYHIMNDQEVIDGLRANGYDQTTIDQLILTWENLAETIKIELPSPDNYFPVYQVPDHIMEMYEQMKDKLIED